MRLFLVAAVAIFWGMPSFALESSALSTAQLAMADTEADSSVEHNKEKLIMKKIIILLASVALFSGCAPTETIKRLESQSGQSVFQVVSQSSTAPATGFGDLQISLSVKTRKSGTVLFDTTDYGTERYQMLVGVKGQTQRVIGTMTTETGAYHGSTDPEAGNGVRYAFTTTLRLPVGTHKISVALPGDGTLLEQDVTIRDGLQKLELKPVYKSRNPHRLIGFNGDRSYYEGVKRLQNIGQGR